MTKQTTSATPGDRKLFRIAGAILVIASMIGIIFSLVGIAAIWQAKTNLSLKIASSLDSINTSLEATHLGLENAETTLRNTSLSLETLQNTLKTTAATVETTAPALNSLATITREDLPNIVNTAQTSLTSAQESARVIDQVMRALAVLPIVNYDPDMPLHQSLGELANSMDRLPAAFFTMQAGMAATERNLTSVQDDINQVAVNVSDIRLSLEDNYPVIAEYQKMVENIRKQVNELAEHIPGWLLATTWMATILLGWGILLQSGIFALGLALLKSPQHFPQNGL